MIALVGARPEDVPLIDPAVFAPTIRQMVEHHIIPGRVHEADFRYFSHLRDGAVFCDVGANLGASILSLAAVGGRCATHSFEINPALHPVLTEMAATTPNPWTLHPFGLSDAAGRMALFIPKAGDLYILGEGTLRLDFLQLPHSIQRLTSYTRTGLLEVGRLDVEVRCFDDTGLIPTHVKIDAEGAEQAVLRGMRRTLAAHRPLLMIEAGAMLAVDAELLPLGYRALVYDPEADALRPRSVNVQNVFYVHDSRAGEERILP